MILLLVVNRLCNVPRANFTFRNVSPGSVMILLGSAQDWVQQTQIFQLSRQEPLKMTFYFKAEPKNVYPLRHPPPLTHSIFVSLLVMWSHPWLFSIFWGWQGGDDIVTCECTQFWSGEAPPGGWRYKWLEKGRRMLEPVEDGWPLEGQICKKILSWL